jgi:hypothetical protein
MANKLDEILAKSSPEQREKASQLVESVKANNNLVSNGQEANSIASSNIPNQQKTNPDGLENKAPDAQTKETIENIQKAKGNNHENALGRALDKPTQPTTEQTQAKDKSMDR